MKCSSLSKVFQASVLVATYAVPALASALPQPGIAQGVTSPSAQRISAVFTATPLAEALRLLQTKTPISFEIADPAAASVPVSTVIDAKPVPEAIKLMLQGYAYVMQTEPAHRAIKLTVYSAPEHVTAASSEPMPSQSGTVQVTDTAESSEEDDEPDEQIYPPWRPR